MWLDRFECEITSHLWEWLWSAGMRCYRNNVRVSQLSGENTHLLFRHDWILFPHIVVEKRAKMTKLFLNVNLSCQKRCVLGLGLAWKLIIYIIKYTVMFVFILYDMWFFYQVNFINKTRFTFKFVQHFDGLLCGFIGLCFDGKTR